MKRSRNLVDVWAFLPEFRAIAEWEHLTKAAESIAVTPAALSRTLARLERQLGLRLFERVSRGLQLLPAGRLLLDATREAMRTVDTALVDMAAPIVSRKVLRIGVASAEIGYLLHQVLPEIAQLSDVVEFVVFDDRSLPRMLLSGDMDVAIVSHPPNDERLIVRHIAAAACRWVTSAKPPQPPTPDNGTLLLPVSVGPVPRVLMARHEVRVPVCVDVDVAAQSRPAPTLGLVRVSRTRANEDIKALEQILRTAASPQP